MAYKAEKHRLKCAEKHVKLLAATLKTIDPSSLESKEEKEEIDVLTVGEGYSKSWLVDSKEGERLLCGICGKVAKEVMELGCNEHLETNELESDDENEDEMNGPPSFLFCKKCIESHLKRNKNLCPVGSHPNPSFHASSNSKYQILRLKVRCPNFVNSLESAG